MFPKDGGKHLRAWFSSGTSLWAPLLGRATGQGAWERRPGHPSCQGSPSAVGCRGHPGARWAGAAKTTTGGETEPQCHGQFGDS